MPLTQRFEIIPAGSYLRIRCTDHPEAFPRMRFIEDDGPVAVMELDCPECGSTGPLRCDQFTIAKEWTEGLIAFGETKGLPEN